MHLLALLHLAVLADVPLLPLALLAGHGLDGPADLLLVLLANLGREGDHSAVANDYSRKGKFWDLRYTQYGLQWTRYNGHI